MGKLILAVITFAIAASCITTLAVLGKIQGAYAGGLVVALLVPSPLGALVQGLLRDPPKTLTDDAK